MLFHEYFVSKASPCDDNCAHGTKLPCGSLSDFRQDNPMNFSFSSGKLLNSSTFLYSTNIYSAPCYASHSLMNNEMEERFKSGFPLA